MSNEIVEFLDKIPVGTVIGGAITLAGVGMIKYGKKREIIVL